MMLGCFVLGFVASLGGIVGTACLIVRFIQYKEAQDYAPIKLPLKKIKEFYNLAPEKYKVGDYDYQTGIFIYTPAEHMIYGKEYIMANNYIDWLRSLRFIRQIKNNKIAANDNAHTKDYLQYVLKDAQALQKEAQKQINYVKGEMQKPPVDSIVSYCENNKPMVYDFEMGIDPSTREDKQNDSTFISEKLYNTERTV